jgi:hypothetical protein
LNVRVRFSRHAIQRLEECGLTEEDAQRVLDAPEAISERDIANIYYGRVGARWIGVVVAKDVPWAMTIYWTRPPRSAR